MKRRAFLTTIGAGSIGTGALVGTSGFSRVESQRRVKIEVGEKDDDRTAISFAAFCVEESRDVPDADDIRITEIVYKDEEEEEPVEFTWESDVDLDRVVLKGGQEWYVYDYDPPASSASVEMEGTEAEAFDASDPDDEQELEDRGISESEPCGDGYTGIKLEVEDGQFIPEDNDN